MIAQFLEAQNEFDLRAHMSSTLQASKDFSSVFCSAPFQQMYWHRADKPIIRAESSELSWAQQARHKIS